MRPNLLPYAILGRRKFSELGKCFDTKVFQKLKKHKWLHLENISNMKLSELKQINFKDLFNSRGTRTNLSVWTTFGAPPYSVKV